ncbi:phosphoribosylanthranilate isomerase [Parabacteroides sp. 52]|uniref:phosphoribosylanthranilate isomerase n=1 Tax=unclassified Parabacteroides TaxID=2649774 RepID=UPI0013D47621|nr:MULTISPECIES: phosphoribosylanthranilate isomerase [unclassified Parabacteroides]MDH6535271.1 phosphoribosylanthranilate isomerase [Parabacteroides sp. PM5-20]NDV55834.1 phosphoribosylanthranilate isomerase [Parabacteroides sp. 52]
MIIKVCGMRETENIRQVSQTGIHWIGFIFYDKSPRLFTTEEEGKEIPLTQASRVGVFVNASLEQMIETATKYQLHYLQLHGDETPEVCHQLQKRGFSLIKAFAIATQQDLQKTGAYEGRVDYFLFDTACDNYGGSGKLFDWSVLENYKGNTPFILSGGIKPETAEAINRFTHPQFAGIDLNSGFESAVGKKDIEKLQHFLSSLTCRTFSDDSNN